MLVLEVLIVIFAVALLSFVDYTQHGRSPKNVQPNRFNNHKG